LTSETNSTTFLGFRPPVRTSLKISDIPGTAGTRF
jgi:hypothetical protein